MQYIISDHYLIPPHVRDAYQESIAYLPQTVFFTDMVDEYAGRGCMKENGWIESSATQLTRSDAGFPTKGVLFGFFGRIVKLSPPIVSAWCEILRRVPDSFLILLTFPNQPRTHLKVRHPRLTDRE